MCAMAGVTDKNKSLRARLSDMPAQLPGLNRYQNGLRIVLYVSAYFLVLFLIIVLFKIVLFSDTESEKSRRQSNFDATPATSAVTQSATTQQAETTSARSSVESSSNRYRIVYAESSLRNDNGLYFFVLTDPVDLTNEYFISRIEAIVRSLVKANGNKITIDIFDNREALDVQYKVWVLKEINEPLDKEQEALAERHQIASFEGGTILGPSSNTIILFPNATNKASEVSDLSRSYEFTP
jgi:hypothetical protein